MLPGRADYVIVGGGAAGCVLANRLSADPRVTVLLIEAGSDHPPGHEPDAIADSFPRAAIPDHLWPGLTVERVAGGPRLPFEQGRVIGGGSSVMGMVALRGLPGDYDDWQATGAAGWGWDDVLPYFRRLEQDLDFSGPLHGKDGPLPVRRHLASDWPPFASAIAGALNRRGLPTIDDLNANFEDGVGPTPMTNTPLRRVSVATAYLNDAVRSRANLHIVAGRQVAHVRIADGRAEGVALDDGTRIDASEVILSAGAIHSPALLLASGIGPGQTIDRDGVGRNLQTHPLIALSTVLRRHARQPERLRPAFQNSLRCSSGIDGSRAGDLYLSVLNKTALHPVGMRLGALMLSLYQPLSRGSVALSAGRPDVRFDMLSDERDLQRLAGGLILCRDLLADPAVAGTCHLPFAPTNMPLIRLLGQSHWRARLLARMGSWALGGPAPIAAMGIARAGPRLDDIVASADSLNAFVRQSVVPTGHVCGTCRIGAANDEGAVVDPQLRVIGVDRLRVVDASVMPTVPRANTHIPTVMIAEKAADLIREARP